MVYYLNGILVQAVHSDYQKLLSYAGHLLLSAGHLIELNRSSLLDNLIPTRLSRYVQHIHCVQPSWSAMSMLRSNSN